MSKRVMSMHRSDKDVKSAALRALADVKDTTAGGKDEEQDDLPTSTAGRVDELYLEKDETQVAHEIVVHVGFTSSREENFGKKMVRKLEQKLLTLQTIVMGPLKPVPFMKLFSFADSVDSLLMFLGAFGACVHGVAVPLFFVLFGRLIDAFGSNYKNPARMAPDVDKNALNLFNLGLMVMGASWLEVACWRQTGERQCARLRVKYLEAVLSQDVGFFDTDTTAQIVRCVTSDIFVLQDAISAKAGNCIHFTAKCFAGFVVRFSTVWQLSLITISVVPAIIVAGFAYACTTSGHATKSQKVYEEANKVAEEVLTQVRTVYAFVGEGRAVRAYAKALQTTLKLGKQGGLAKGLGLGLTYGLCLAAWALLLWYTGILVHHGATNGGKAFAAILNVIVAGIALGQTSPNLMAFSRGRSAAYNIIQMINQKTLAGQTNMAGKQLPQVEGNIELCNISFSYPSNPNVPVFENFSLSIEAAKSLAIVGSSGCGKSTVASLIHRFYNPTSGEVLLDGTNIKTLDLRWLRNQIGLVNHEPALFATSIRENILYGKNDVSMEEIVAAAKASCSHHFISQLPEGYDTQVGERGVQLSGGERQQVAIARAILKNPKILILDGATSTLDTRSAQVVQEALDLLMVGRTTVIIAHHLSTIQHADLIAVMQHGKVLETGTHEELLAKTEDGTYAALFRFQEAGPCGRADANTSGIHARFSFTGVEGVNERENLGIISTSCSKPSLRRVLMLNAPEWHYGLLGGIGAIVVGCQFPLMALIIGQFLVTFYNPDKDFVEREVHKYTLIISGVSAIVVMGHLIQHYFLAAMGENLTKRVREMLFSRILQNEVGYFDHDESNSSVLGSCLSTDAASIRAAVGDRLSTVVQNLSLVFTALVIVFVLEWRVAFVVVATFPFLIVALVGENVFIRGFGGSLPKAYAKASMVVVQAVSSIRTVAAFCAEEKVLNSFIHELRVPQKKIFRHGQVAGLCYGISQFYMYSTYALVLWYSSSLLRKGEANFGSAIKMPMVLLFAAFGIAETIAMAPDIFNGNQALAVIFHMMDRQTQIDPDDLQAEKVKEVKGDIELRHVMFSYPTKPDVPIFKDTNMRVGAGNRLVLVGASGSGKSSILALIQRFYDPIMGQVTIDGKDIRKLNLRSLRRHIGIVQQNPALFGTSIYENIWYGKECALESEIVEAAKTAYAHSFISGLPDGYRTAVGEGGIELSGGQKQRVAIACAVLKSPVILLLHEETSALDVHSEKLVYKALDLVMAGRTTVLIAHHFSTIKKRDIIAVLKDGTVIEQGSHQDLITSPFSAYAQLIKLQTTPP